MFQGASAGTGENAAEQADSLTSAEAPVEDRQ